MYRVYWTAQLIPNKYYHVPFHQTERFAQKNNRAWDYGIPATPIVLYLGQEDSAYKFLVRDQTGYWHGERITLECL